jgi:hypothetical protein
MLAMNREARKLTYCVDLPGGQARLREMILYVSSRSAEMPRFGKTKLNKILWDADFSAYLERGTPVTGRSYQKLKAGPAPIEMPVLLAEMTEAGLLAIEHVQLGEYTEQRTVAKTKPSLHYFSDDDLHYINRSIERYWDMSATQASDNSHGVAWKTRDELDPLPYESALLSNEVLTGHILTRLKERAHEHGWKSS